MSNRKPARVVDGNDFARVYLKYGLERLVADGHLSVEEIPCLDDGGEYSKKLLDDPVVRGRLEEASRGRVKRSGSEQVR
jgi:hypothetical protein